MTVLRKHRDSISNYFDAIERGVGKRGSTFTDVDAVSHDSDTDRFLFREFKQQDEAVDKSQQWTLRALSRLQRCTVWLVRKRDDGRLGWAQFGVTEVERAITTPEYRGRLKSWWDNTSYSASKNTPEPGQQAHSHDQRELQQVCPHDQREGVFCNRCGKTVGGNVEKYEV